jgi:hypothetical protein
MSAVERADVIRSSIFLKRKTHPDGSFDKYKARLVAGGDMQDKKLYAHSLDQLSVHDRSHRSP